MVTVCFRDPKYEDSFIFEAKRLPGAVDPPNVLAPENRPSGYRPQIGFKRDFPQASLGEAGHRFINHHAGGGYQQRQQQQQQPYQQQQRNYASIAPPNNYRNGEFKNTNSAKSMACITNKISGVEPCLVDAGAGRRIMTPNIDIMHIR